MKMRFYSTAALYVALLVAGLQLPSIAYSKSDTSCHKQVVASFGTAIEGHALLCSSPVGLNASMLTRGLVPGDAYTVWWVYIDDPSACSIPGQCGPADFGGDNPLPVFGRMDSTVAKRAGRSWFTDRVRGLVPSEGSQVWLLVFGHGPADDYDNRHLARQLLTPEDPTAGAPHLGNHVDGPLGFPAAVAVFAF